jgi:hypothetical protein
MGKVRNAYTMLVMNTEGKACLGSLIKIGGIITDKILKK